MTLKIYANSFVQDALILVRIRQKYNNQLQVIKHVGDPPPPTLSRHKNLFRQQLLLHQQSEVKRHDGAAFRGTVACLEKVDAGEDSEIPMNHIVRKSLPNKEVNYHSCQDSTNSGKKERLTNETDSMQLNPLHQGRILLG